MMGLLYLAASHGTKSRTHSFFSQRGFSRNSELGILAGRHLHMTDNEGKNLHFSMLRNVGLANAWQSRRITFCRSTENVGSGTQLPVDKSLSRGQKLSRRRAAYGRKPDSREWHRYTEHSITGVVCLLFPTNRGSAFGLLPNKPQLVLLGRR